MKKLYKINNQNKSIDNKAFFKFPLRGNLRGLGLLSILSVAVLIFSACQEELDKSIAFDVTATASGSSMSGDTLVVKKNTPITFSFSGNADVVTFYSGKPGSEYSKRNLLLSPVEETSSVLKFGNMPQYGIIPGTLKVYVSTSFEGLLLNNKAKDSLAVVTHAWEEITDKCNLSVVSAQVNNSSISLNEYLGKRLTIAFRYKTDQNAGVQPTWEIQNLQIENTFKSGSTSVLKAASLGFGVIDLLNTTAPYKNTSGAGTWDISAIATKMRISSSPAGQPMNDDWLISNPITVNTRTPDAGVAIKATANRLETYNYTFDTAGKYTVTMVGIKASYLNESESVKNIVIKVVD